MCQLSRSGRLIAKSTARPAYTTERVRYMTKLTFQIPASLRLATASELSAHIPTNADVVQAYGRAAVMRRA